MTNKTYLVTRDSIATALRDTRPGFVEKYIGKALVVLLNRQTEAEADTNTTNLHNKVGFSAADAHSGCLTAKYWLKNKKLEDWMIAKWTKIGRSGYPRLSKYWEQLDHAAKLKELRESQK